MMRTGMVTKFQDEERFVECIRSNPNSNAFFFKKREACKLRGNVVTKIK
jgi:hypothetical protein